MLKLMIKKRVVKLSVRKIVLNTIRKRKLRRRIMV